MLADALQIEQVVANLLQNALDAVVQADPPDRRVVLSAKAEGPDVVRVAVADRGAGIDPQIAGTLFNPFATSKPGGMGMGLFIARSIVEAHGGSMEVDSHPGDGATFSFTLPTMTRSDDVAS